MLDVNRCLTSFKLNDQGEYNLKELFTVNNFSQKSKIYFVLHVCGFWFDLQCCFDLL